MVQCISTNNIPQECDDQSAAMEAFSSFGNSLRTSTRQLVVLRAGLDVCQEPTLLFETFMKARE